MREIFNAAGFFQEIRRNMRYGELSRLPLRLWRFELIHDSVECDWFMRPSDPWDLQLPSHVREERITLQALNDALKMRELIFRAFPSIQHADLRIYRESKLEPPALMMTGRIDRKNEVLPRIISIVMRAKLYGFQFSLEDGVLERIGSSELQVSY